MNTGLEPFIRFVALINDFHGDNDNSISQLKTMKRAKFLQQTDFLIELITTLYIRV